MIMQNKRIFFEDMSQFEKTINELKLQFFSLMNSIVEVNFISPYLFRILIILEALQLAFFSIHPRLEFIWDNSVFVTVQNILKNIQFQGFLDSGNGSIMKSLVYLCFGINLFMFILLILTGYTLHKKSKNKQNYGVITYGLKLLSLYGLLVKTIQPLPFFDIFLNAIVCQQSKFQDIECYSGLYFIQVSLAVIGLIIQVFFSFVFNMMMIDLNPFSKLPFASPPNVITEIKLLLKFLVTFYFAVDYEAKLQLTLTILLTFYYLIFMVQMYNKTPYYNFITQRCQIVADITLFWISFCASVQSILIKRNHTSETNITSFYLLIGIPLVSSLYILLLKQRDSKYTQLHPEEIKKPDDMENFALILINLIENRQDRSCLITLEGILHMHAGKCKESPEICPCSFLIQKEIKKHEDNNNNNHNNIESQAISKKNAEEEEKKWYLFLRSVINIILRKYNKCSKLHLLNGYIYHEKLKLKFKALTEMMTSEMFKPTLREKFSMFRYKFQIELDIIETDMRNEQNKNVDVNGIVHFENQLVIFMKSIERSVNLHLEFWRELLEESPDIEKLQIVGSRITNTIEDAQACFHNLCSIRQNNIRSLLIYGNFLKEVVNDELEAQEFLEKAAYVSKSTVVNKQFADNENMKYSENSNTGILTMSANLDTRFYVQNTNYDFSRILGWPKHEIVDQNIKNHIMPKLIQSIHDGLVSHYIETSIPRAIGIERLITPTNKDGFIVPSILMIKILPNLEDGLQFVGFFKEKDEIFCYPYVRTDNFDEDIIHYLIYKLDSNLQNQTIVGITQGVYKNFGVPTSLINNNSPMSNQFTVDLIMPDIIDPKIMDEMKTEQGAQITLDTTIIDQLFLISQESEENDENTMSKAPFGYHNDEKDNELEQDPDAPEKSNLSEDKLNKRYKKCQINIWLEEEFSYKDTTIHIIKFVELQPEDSMDNEIGVDNNQQTTINNQQVGQSNQRKQEEIQGYQDNYMHQEDEHDNQQDEGEEVQQHSNLSANSQDYEELRQLKDIKSAISEKTKPKTIKILQRSVILICIFMFILTGVDLSYKVDEYDQMQEAMNAIYYAYNRHSIMADVNYLTRKIWFLGNDYILPPATQTKDAYGIALKNQLDAKVKQLNDIQFNTSKAQMSIEKRKGSDLKSLQINTKKLLPNGVVKESIANFTDSLNVYMAEAGGLANTTVGDFLDSLSTSTQVTTTKSNFFSVNWNGIYPLRLGSEEMSLVIYDYYYDQISSFQVIFVVIMILSLVIVSVSQVILLPIVFSVQKTNAIVLSFFAIVPVGEIQTFATRCEKFLKIFIERKQETEAHDNDQDNKNMVGGPEQNNNNNNGDQNNGQNEENKQEDHTNGEKNPMPGVYIIANEQSHNMSYIQNNNNNASFINQSQNPNQSINQSYNYDPMGQGLMSANNNNFSKIQQPHLVPIANPSQFNTQRQTNLLLEQQHQQKLMLERQKEEEEKKNEDEENQRQKILNAKDHKKKYVILQFAGLTSILMIYFILNYAVLEMNFQNNIQTLFTHTKYARMRPSLLKYYFDFIQEGITNVSPILELNSSKVLQSEYSDNIQQNDNFITSSFKDSFPSQFSTYKTSFDNINYGSVCLNSKITISSDQQLSCKDISALNSGLQRVVTQIGINGQSILAKISDYEKLGGDKKTQSQDLLKLTTYQEIENMMVFVAPTIDQLNDQFWSAYKDYLDFKNMIDKLCFALFVVFVCVIFVFIWIPYLSALIKRIWMTKGVLNMIPIDIILKHEKLRQAFTAGDILSAVK